MDPNGHPKMLKRNSCEVSQPAAANHQSATATMSRLALPEATQPVPRSPFSSQFDNNEKGGGEQNGTRRNRLAGLGGEGASLRTSPPEPREGLPARRESPERAEPSLVGAWGNPPTPPDPLPAREAGGCRGWRGANSHAPLRSCESEPGRVAGQSPSTSPRTIGSCRRPDSECKPEFTEGRPWGQPLKKPAGAPLNLG